MKTEVSHKYNAEFKNIINNAVVCCIRHNCESPEDEEDDASALLGPVSSYNYYPGNFIHELLTDVSIRWNADLADYLYSLEYCGESFTFNTWERDWYYANKNEMRDVYLKYEPDIFDHYLSQFVDKPDDFALANTSCDRCELFDHTLGYAIKFGDWEEFKEYMGDKLETYKKYLKKHKSFEELFSIDYGYYPVMDPSEEIETVEPQY